MFLMFSKGRKESIYISQTTKLQDWKAENWTNDVENQGHKDHNVGGHSGGMTV